MPRTTTNKSSDTATEQTEPVAEVTEEQTEDQPVVLKPGDVDPATGETVPLLDLLDLVPSDIDSVEAEGIADRFGIEADPDSKTRIDAAVVAEGANEYAHFSLLARDSGLRLKGATNRAGWALGQIRFGITMDHPQLGIVPDIGGKSAEYLAIVEGEKSLDSTVWTLGEGATDGQRTEVKQQMQAFRQKSRTQYLRNYARSMALDWLTEYHSTLAEGVSGAYGFTGAEWDALIPNKGWTADTVEADGFVSKPSVPPGFDNADNKVHQAVVRLFEGAGLTDPWKTVRGGASPQDQTGQDQGNRPSPDAIGAKVAEDLAAEGEGGITDEAALLIGVRVLSALSLRTAIRKDAEGTALWERMNALCVMTLKSRSGSFNEADATALNALRYDPKTEGPRSEQ